jgi:hypothetical protein
LQRLELDVPIADKTFEVVVDVETLVPVVLGRAKKSRVAVSVDGFRLARSDGSWAFHPKRNDALCAHLATLFGVNVQRSAFDLATVKRSKGRQLNLYTGAWWMDEDNVPSRFREAAPSFSLLVPSDKDENFRFGFSSMINCVIEHSGAAAACSSAAAASSSVAETSAGGSGAGSGAAADGPSLFDRFLQFQAEKRAAASASAPAAVAAVAAVAEADSEEDVSEHVSKRKRVNKKGDANVTSAVQQPFSMRHKTDAGRDEEAAEHDGAASGVKLARDEVPDPSFGLVGVSAFSAFATTDLALPLPAVMSMTVGASMTAGGSKLWRSPPRSAGGGAGGCAPLSDLAECGGAFETSAAAAMASLHRLRGKLRVDDDDEDELKEAAAARPRSRMGVPLRSESFSDAVGVSALVSFAASKRDEEEEERLTTRSPSAVLAAGFETLDLHADTFQDMPLSAIGPLCMFSLPRFLRSHEPDGVRYGTRCSFCWRWATQRCVECVKGGGVHVVCDACVDVVGLEDVTCLGCLPVEKTAEGDQCVKSRLSLKEASV